MSVLPATAALLVSSSENVASRKLSLEPVARLAWSVPNAKAPPERLTLIVPKPLILFEKVWSPVP